MLTPQEKNLIIKLADCYNDFVELCKSDPGSTAITDRGEFAGTLHILQRQVSAREARRNNPDILTNMTTVKEK